MNKNQKPTDKLNSLFKQTKQYLKLNNDVIVTQSDKGNITVIMDLADYNTQNS